MADLLDQPDVRVEPKRNHCQIAQWKAYDNLADRCNCSLEGGGLWSRETRSMKRRERKREVRVSKHILERQFMRFQVGTVL